MCLAVPGKITEIFHSGPMRMAMVDFEGVGKEVCVEWVPDANVGSFVIVHAGFAINILDEKEAVENLKLIREAARMDDAYRKW